MLAGRNCLGYACPQMFRTRANRHPTLGRKPGPEAGPVEMLTSPDHPGTGLAPRRGKRLVTRRACVLPRRRGLAAVARATPPPRCCAGAQACWCRRSRPTLPGSGVRCARDQLAVLGLERGVRDLKHIESSHVDVIGEVGACLLLNGCRSPHRAITGSHPDQAGPRIASQDRLSSGRARTSPPGGESVRKAGQWCH
jgi:hypothetical protein